MSSTSGHAQQTKPPPSILQSITEELDRNGPRFDVNADQVTVLSGPKEFYKTLKDKLRSAKRRVYFATLYVGKTEKELMDCIEEALNLNPGLKVSILTDALRGTRESPETSCASLLAHLAAKFPRQVEIRLYHTPNLTGTRKRLIPKRINEGWGLQHMKLYGIDDEVILSGANLSEDYFTNRQDRYHVFSCPRVTEYFAEIHNIMCNASFLMTPDTVPQGYSLSWPKTNACISPLEDPKGYIHATKSMFTSLIAPPKNTKPSTTNTSIYPMLIIPYALNTELPTITRLLAHNFPNGSTYLFTAGYFNPHKSVTTSLLSAAAAGIQGTVVTASPWANGFYGSKGVSGLLPPAYTLLSRRFLKAAEQQAPDAVQLREWRLGTVGRPHGWTYHAKGLWINMQGPAQREKAGTASPQAEHRSEEATITVIGSSNYTVRSYFLDTEVGAVITTTDPSLRRQLQREQDGLLEHSRTVELKDLQGGERKVGLGVRVAMWIVTAVGGSL